MHIDCIHKFHCTCIVATVESPVLKSIESLNHGSSGELSLMQASKFGFMIETCILAARNDECLVCPAHKEHPLIIRDIAPDLVRNLRGFFQTVCIVAAFMAKSCLWTVKSSLVVFIYVDICRLTKWVYPGSSVC